MAQVVKGPTASIGSIGVATLPPQPTNEARTSVIALASLSPALKVQFRAVAFDIRRFPTAEKLASTFSFGLMPVAVSRLEPAACPLVAGSLVTLALTVSVKVATARSELSVISQTSVAIPREIPSPSFGTWFQRI